MVSDYCLLSVFHNPRTSPDVMHGNLIFLNLLIVPHAYFLVFGLCMKLSHLQERMNVNH